jgi:hypothetical protein
MGINHLNAKHNLIKSKRKKGLRLSQHVKLVGSSVIRLAANVLQLGEVPHRINLIINHCAFSGIALNRCWVQYFI